MRETENKYLMKSELPPRLLSSLKGLPGFDETAFVNVHESGDQLTSIRFNPKKLPVSDASLVFKSNLGERIPWTKHGYYLIERPSFTFDPLFHAGVYYVQEASSMFLEEALKQTVDLSKPLKILDLSAAPGGKSTHLQSLISKNSLLVSNDVIRSRANILKDNIIKWGTSNVVVTNNDPRDFSKLKNYFDVIVVDAPCSGSGLFRRNPDAIDEWSENNVQLCSQRQQRILADIWPCLKSDGVLIYSTCSYSKEENENITDWVRSNLDGTFKLLDIEPSWGIVDTGKGYRFWPDKTRGEGFFLSVFKKNGDDDHTALKRSLKIPLVSKKEREILKDWIQDKDSGFIKHENTVYAWANDHVTDFTLLLSELRVIYSGIRIGELLRDKVIPDHALAMSPLHDINLPVTPVNFEQAINYLKRKDMVIGTRETGWQLITFKGYSLGWINALANRINNYYPKEFRILKDD